MGQTDNVDTKELNNTLAVRNFLCNKIIPLFFRNLQGWRIGLKIMELTKNIIYFRNPKTSSFQFFVIREVSVTCWTQIKRLERTIQWLIVQCTQHLQSRNLNYVVEKKQNQLDFQVSSTVESVKSSGPPRYITKKICSIPFDSKLTKYKYHQGTIFFQESRKMYWSKLEILHRDHFSRCLLTEVSLLELGNLYLNWCGDFCSKSKKVFLVTQFIVKNMESLFMQPFAT